MVKTTYSENDFIINLVISSLKTLNPIIISQYIEYYFDTIIDTEEILKYIKTYSTTKKKSFSLKMEDIF